MSSYTKMQIDTMWTEHLKTVKWLVGFLLRMFTGLPGTFFSRNSTAKYILVTFELMSRLKGKDFVVFRFIANLFSLSFSLQPLI